MTPVDPIRRLSQAVRRHTVAFPSPSLNPNRPGDTPTADAPMALPIRSLSDDTKSHNNTEDPSRRRSDPFPIRPKRAAVSSRIASSVESPPSPIEQLHKSPFHSSLNIASTALKPEKLREHKARHLEIDINKEMPHSLHTSAVIAGAVAVHVPKRFRAMLRARNWERLPLDNKLREISTEYAREPTCDPAFQEFYQYILPPTALLIDATFRVYPESMFREALAGLLQLGFGLYQLVSADAKMSVAKDGLASPYLLVLPYLGMAIVNIIVNIMDPPYSVITVLDISKRARQSLNDHADFSPNLSPISSLSPADTFDRPNFFFREPSYGGTSRQKDMEETKPVIWEESGELSKPEVTEKFFSDGHGTWSELTEWVDFAYGNRLDICPVDRLYQSPWLSHAIVIGEFLWCAFSALLVPAVLLATIGTWTHFRTSTFGYSLAFNLLALFGLPFLQFILCICHLFSRVQRDLKGRREHGSTYWEPSTDHHQDEKPRVWWRWMTGRIKKRSRWWDVVAQSMGLYFPVRKTIIAIFVFLLVGIATCEFVLVGFNLMRTLNCNMDLLM